MVRSSYWIGDEIGSRNDFHGRGLSFYILHHQEVEGKVFHFCLPDAVACKTLPQRDGVETRKIKLGNTLALCKKFVLVSFP